MIWYRYIYLLKWAVETHNHEESYMEKIECLGIGTPHHIHPQRGDLLIIEFEEPDGRKDGDSPSVDVHYGCYGQT
jgi:hypothetical protein